MGGNAVNGRFLILMEWLAKELSEASEEKTPTRYEVIRFVVQATILFYLVLSHARGGLPGC